MDLHLHLLNSEKDNSTRLVNGRIGIIFTSDRDSDKAVAALLNAPVEQTGWLFMEEDYPGSDQEIDRYAKNAAAEIQRQSAGVDDIAIVGSQIGLLIAVACQLFPEHREKLYRIKGDYIKVSDSSVITASIK